MVVADFEWRELKEAEREGMLTCMRNEERRLGEEVNADISLGYSHLLLMHKEELKAVKAKLKEEEVKYNGIKK